MAQLRTVKVKELECRTCKAKGRTCRWFPRIDKTTGKVVQPKNCPNPECKSPFYNRPYARK